MNRYLPIKTSVGAKYAKPIEKSSQPHKISITEAMQQHRQTLGLEPLSLEPELLLNRIKQGGHSGVFLAAAYLSAYRRTPFIHSLGDLTKLDAEAFRLLIKQA